MSGWGPLGAAQVAALIAALALSACGGGDADGEAPATRALAGDSRDVECALDGAEQFASICTMQRIDGPDGASWRLLRPDGGFRRVVRGDGASGYGAADGADPAVSEITGDMVVLALGYDRFRWPATQDRTDNAPADAPSPGAAPGPSQSPDPS